MNGQGRSLPRQKRSKSKNQESARPIVSGSKKVKKLTVDDVFDLMEARGQHRLLVSLGGALALELGQESSLFLPCLVLRFLEQLLLLRQLRSQQITLHGELVALLPLGVQGGVGLAQLLLKSGVGL